MKMSDMMQRDYEKRKNSRDEKEILTGKFNEAASKGINKFIENIETGVIDIGSVTEAGRLFQIFMELNNLRENSGDGTGTLPTLAQTQSSMFSDYVEEIQTGEEEGEVEEYVNEESISNMSTEELDKFLNRREEQVNLDNESMG